MNSVRLSVVGLEQVETQERVRDQLEGIIGVKNVILSEGQNYMDIKYDDHTSVAEINNHLQNNGYKVIDADE
ncbi:hypothetical protein [Anaeromicropila herbilytica]|uniref:HMA domain-containing protein n=1 Tax=Anaeromicropila herbilytica TaxID=2785025 RepID=A0A7R7EIA3_9FIRM|nr:hypothetical protein [Anaeromicropila herbilytica]BCN29366.1 hypothetical protein bsdtb5_06610 [Anaeromicropila herbilytica]